MKGQGSLLRKAAVALFTNVQLLLAMDTRNVYFQVRSMGEGTIALATLVRLHLAMNTRLVSPEAGLARKCRVTFRTPMSVRHAMNFGDMLLERIASREGSVALNALLEPQAEMDGFVVTLEVIERLALE